jgi:hypothetical protein
LKPTSEKIHKNTCRFLFQNVPPEADYKSGIRRRWVTMDITSGIAKLSMEMASARVTTGVQAAVLKNVMDVQQESLAILLESLGVGGQLNIRG